MSEHEGMFGAWASSLRHGPRLASVAALLGACANVIGVSGYEVDPSLDPTAAGAGSGGDSARPQGGSNPAAGGSEVVDPGGAPGDGLAGQAQGGQAGGSADASVGGGAGDTGLAGSGPDIVGGQGGTGTGPDVECHSALECDDGVGCTIDSCDGNGNCAHAPDSSLCTAGPEECLACDAEQGCVSRALATKELLKDKDFDLLTGDWSEYSVNYEYNIFSWEFADTPENVAEFGPTPFDVEEQEYGLMSQRVAIPQGTVKLTLSGVYQLTPGGTSLDIYDSVYVSLYAGTTQNQVYAFNVWNGTDIEHTFWKSFSYEATRADLTSVLGKQARLEFEAYAWDSLFDFDSLSLKASYCPP
jgi:hypothetical protein